MENELLDIDETGEGRIDDSTIHILNAIKPWLIPFAIALFVVGALFLVGFASLASRGMPIQLDIMQLVITIGFGAFGVGFMIAGVILIKMRSAVKKLKGTDSSFRLNQVLKARNRFMMTFAVIFIAMAVMILSILGYESMGQNGWS